MSLEMGWWIFAVAALFPGRGKGEPSGVQHGLQSQISSSRTDGGASDGYVFVRSLESM
jgi:hypothetical protein